MREIKFRGFCRRINKWVFGDLIKSNNDFFIAKQNTLKGIYTKLPKFVVNLDKNLKRKCTPKTNVVKDGLGFKINFDIFKIEKNSIGQYTYLKDVNDVEIYEGDIVRVTDMKYNTRTFHEIKYFIGFDLEPKLRWVEINNLHYVTNNCKYKIEVVDNIFEKSKLKEIYEL